MKVSREYLEALFKQAKEYLPAAIWKELHRAALPSAGGKASWRSPNVNILERTGINSMTEEIASGLEDDELFDAMATLSKLYSSAKRTKQDGDTFLTAGSCIYSEIKSRNPDASMSGSFVEDIKSKLEKAVWSRAFINDLPDSAFLYIEPGGEKDDEGKTKPRSLRYFPVKDQNGKVDLPHLRNALARIPQSKLSAEVKEQATVKARKLLEQEHEKLEKAEIIKKLSGKDRVDYELETELIKANKKSKQAQRSHKFKAAKWTHPNGHPRCLICGDEERTGGWCEGASVEKAINGDETDASKFWDQHWQEMFPPTGKGKFTYQHHWRGLNEQEAQQSESELLSTDHSIHGDLRFERDGDELWGFTVFLGKAADNEEKDRLFSLEQDAKLRTTVKGAIDHSWLDVGAQKPAIIEPGKPGATKDSFAKIFKEDGGEYQIGVWNRHLVEIFVTGDKLKGRMLFQSVPIDENQRAWMVSRPEDQTPLAEQRDLDSMLAELKPKGHKWLVWAQPGEKPKLIDVQTGKVAKSIYLPITCSNDEKQIAYSVVAEPDTEDAHGAFLDKQEIEQACHEFMEFLNIGSEHLKKINARVVENLIVPPDVKTFYGVKVKPGSWIAGIKVMDPEEWKRVKSGEYTGFSLGGYARKEKR